MRTIFTIILIFNLLSLQAQTVTIPASSDKKEFKNQGEQEDSMAVQFFEKNYSNQTFSKYDSNIIVSGDTVKYSDKCFLVSVPTEFRNIFSSGIFYPTIITGQIKFINYKCILTISGVEELKFLTDSPTRKRFRFWLGRMDLFNPIVCFIELTNQNATDKTDIETFIKGASLTFYKEGWVII